MTTPNIKQEVSNVILLVGTIHDTLLLHIYHMVLNFSEEYNLIPSFYQHAVSL